MSENVVLRGDDGAYYAFETELFEGRRRSSADGDYYDFTAEERAAARVPDDRVGAAEEALGVPEVAGFGGPIPGIYGIKLGKNPGGAIAVNVGSISFTAGMVAPTQPPGMGGAGLKGY